MDVKPTAIPDVLVIDLDVFADERGYFFERFNDARFAKYGLPLRFRQDNQSRSHRDVLRGLHYQLHNPQGKLISCIRGRVFDVAVDVRVGSPTFKKWVNVTLSEDKPRLVWIPPGFAHGFCALSDDAEIEYKCTELYDPADERGILWSDRDLAIDWPIARPVLSKRDAALPTISEAESQLPNYSKAAGAKR